MQSGGYSGYDKGLSVLESYGLVSENTYRGRGALLCQTQEGLKMIRPYEGSAERLEQVYELLEHIKDAGHSPADQILRNKEGSLITVDKEGIAYIVKDWRDCRECDARSGSDAVKAVRALAAVHKDMYMKPQETAPDLTETYRRRNLQLNKIREFVRRQKQKNQFEYMFLEHVERYLQYGQEACLRLLDSEYENMRRKEIELGSVIHNGCTQHNFLMNRQEAIPVNYEHFIYDSHVADLAQLMRKVLEKHGWSCTLGMRLIDAYDSVHGISDAEYRHLLIRLSYPEKFWKLANFYYNNRKSFFPERNAEKLAKQMENEKNWITFLDKVWV